MLGLLHECGARIDYLSRRAANFREISASTFESGISLCASVPELAVVVSAGHPFQDLAGDVAEMFLGLSRSTESVREKLMAEVKTFSFKRLFLVLGGGFFIAACFLSGVTGSMNCGGNSAALSGVWRYAFMASFEAEDSPQHEFIVTDPPSDGERQDLRAIAFIVRGAHLLVSTKPVLATEKNSRRIIIVCDTAFNNVRRHLWERAPTHAVGFADGSKGLISEKEYAALDLSGFVPLDRLYPRAAEKETTR